MLTNSRMPKRLNSNGLKWVAIIAMLIVYCLRGVSFSSPGGWVPALLASPINCGAFCMIAGLVIVPVVSLFTPRPGKALVDDAFSCYEEKVTVRKSQALGDPQ